jgi:5-methylcytosine-specific restriction endonuclease McrA
MFDIFFARCTKKANKYYLNWIVKCYYLYNNINKNIDTTIKKQYPEQCDIFILKDNTIQQDIKKNSPASNLNKKELFSNFDNVFTRFILFLKKINGDDNKIVFNPTQMFALFSSFCNKTINKLNECYVLSHLYYFSKIGCCKENKSLWEKDNVEIRRKYFNQCIDIIKTYTSDYAIIIDTKQISQKLKKQVMQKTNNKCYCCEKTNDQLEVGHIIARVLGGKTELSNLLPVCANCNKNMGIRTPNEYKLSVYPYLCQNRLILAP